MNRSVGLYVFAVAILASVVGWSLYQPAVGVDPLFLQAALCFASLGTFAHLLRYDLARAATGSIAFIPYLAVVVVAPNWIGVAAVALSVWIVETLLRRSAIKALFNVAQHALAVGLSALVFTQAGGVSLLQDVEFRALPFLSLFVTYALTNSAAVSGVIALSESRSVLAVWRENTLRTVAYDLLSLPVVYAFGWVYVNGGPIGVAILAVPLLGVRQLYITNWKLERTNQELLELMVAAIEARDPYTSGHSRRVAQYSKVVARAAGLSSKEVERIGVAALLHDVGKIHEIFAPILRKPDSLTPEEWEIMKTHPIKSAELVQHVSQLKDVIAPLRNHHENWDGTGYPDGLAGEQIPLYARVIMFADTIDAMTTDRPYRAALDEAAVRAELVRMRGRQFDPRLCDLLLSSPLFGQIFDPRMSKRTPRALVGDLSAQRIRLRA
jgi:HD-GYP domain-containing protein (c-di-GMP phosphodiesterase class II)